MGNVASFNPSGAYVYRGTGRIPRNARRVEVHRSVTFLPDRLFAGCDRLESVRLPEGLLRIGRRTFSGCTSLTSLRCPATVVAIGEGAFRRCSNLATIELPAGLGSIEDVTFFQCTSLREIQIPASVEWIGDGAFCGCTTLASVELREGLRKIGDDAFSDCRSLERLRVPLSVDEVGVEAFDCCSSLSFVLLHEDLPRMKRFAFGGCTSLERFEFARLSKRRSVVRMDDRTKSMFEDRLREMTLALTGSDYYDEFGNRMVRGEDEGGLDAIWEKCKESLGRAHELLAYLELKGAAPVLELALWKGKIEGERGEGGQGELVDKENAEQDLSDADSRLHRKDCRVKCGADIVSAEVLEFFAYSTSWPRLDD